jgi:hypothetical protein
MVSNQLQILELSLLQSIVGVDQMEKLILSALRGDDKHQKHHHHGNGFFSSVMKNIKTTLSGNEDLTVYKVRLLITVAVSLITVADCLFSNPLLF